MKKNLLKLMPLMAMAALSSCGGSNTLTVFTEAGFAPFEYISNGKIVGVDVDIMNLVGQKLNKNVVFENIAFDKVVDTVSAGKLGNVGAAGLSITDARKEKVDFSDVYYTANLYVIYDTTAHADIAHTMTDGVTGVYWSSLQTTKGIGVQDGTTTDLFLQDEIAEGGSLEGVNKAGYSSYLTAVNDVNLNIDYLLADELPAQQLIKGKTNFTALPLYWAGGEGEDDEKAFDEYAIAVTKGQTAILNAINAVIAELKADVKAGANGIQQLINNHLGIN